MKNKVERFGIIAMGLLYFGVLFALSSSPKVTCSTHSADVIEIGGKFDSAVLSESTSSIVAIETFAATGKNNPTPPDLKIVLYGCGAAEQQLQQAQSYMISFSRIQLKFAKTDIAQPFSSFT